MLKNFLFVLSRFRASSLLNIIGLSVAFTVFIIIMMQADYDLRFDKSVKNSDRIFRIEFIGGISGERQAVICRPMLELIFKASPHIVAGSLMSGWTSESFLKVENEGKQSLFKVIGQGIDSAFVSVFQPEMVEGSAHAIEDPNTVLIPLSLARKMFGQTSAVGKQVQADNNTSQTIGAVYRDFPDNSSVQNAVYYNIGNENKNSWGNFNYNAFVLLDNPAVVAEVVEQMRKAIPLDNEVFRFGENHTFRLDALKDLHFINDVSWDRTPKASRQKLALLFAIAFAILIIAAINFVNFSMALVPGRIRSINTQKILGATLTELRVKLVSEAAIMCLVSFVLALILVYMLSDVQLVAGLIDAKMNLLAFPRLIGLSAVIALALGVFAGLYPAFYSTSVPPALALKGTFGLSPQGRMLRNTLISVQFVASLVLIISASFMYLQNRYLFTMPLGYDRNGVIISDMNSNIKNRKDVLTNELKAFNGIEDVAFAHSIIGSADQYMGWGRGYKDGDITFQCLPVSSNFLSVMNIHVSEGRDFRDDDRLKRYGTYIFNEKARQQFEIELNTYIDSAEIVGFIPDVHFQTFHTETSPMAFFESGTGYGDMTSSVYIKVNAESGMYAAMEHVKSVFRRLDPEYPFNIRFYDDVLQRAYSKDSRMTAQITIFGVVSIIISLIGVFGLVLFETRFRRREIAIRKVHGSTTGEVVSLFTRNYLLIWAICFVVACPVAWLFVNRWLSGFAYRTPLYAWVFAAGGAVVLAITAATVICQSAKTAMQNPVESIKSE